MNLVPAVVSTTWTKEQVDCGNEALRILDVTWYSTQDGRKDYLVDHIPGAYWFDIMNRVEHTELFPRNLPEPGIFQDNVRSAGINKDTHIILYDSCGKGGLFVAARAWWMFKLFGHEKVSVMNGGIQKWKADGYTITCELPQFTRGDFVAQLTECYRKKYKSMVENLKKKDFEVCDSRPHATYSGSKEDPHTGHYPGAKNIPFAAKLLDKDKNVLKDIQELKNVFTEAGVDLSRPLVTMCNGGMSSCSLMLAAYICGNNSPSVYHGGFTEWRNMADSDQIEYSD